MMTFTNGLAGVKYLIDLHINYETVTPLPLKRIEIPCTDDASQRLNKAKLKADKYKGSIILDESTTVEHIPKIAWEYRLGNRSALEWILDQYINIRKRNQKIQPLLKSSIGTALQIIKSK
ncbi:MAG TPA: type ISP restriction/modification enzyme [Leptolyngbyaceae cyanobacterium]